jgi:polar amino acid transport system substrate-binding protein
VETHSFELRGKNINITISIGVYTHIPQTGDTMENMVSMADKYLYEAKRNGRNRVELNLT